MVNWRNLERAEQIPSLESDIATLKEIRRQFIEDKKNNLLLNPNDAEDPAIQVPTTADVDLFERLLNNLIGALEKKNGRLTSLTWTDLGISNIQAIPCFSINKNLEWSYHKRSFLSAVDFARSINSEIALRELPTPPRVKENEETVPGQSTTRMSDETIEARREMNRRIQGKEDTPVKKSDTDKKITPFSKR